MISFLILYNDRYQTIDKTLESLSGLKDLSFECYLINTTGIHLEIADSLRPHFMEYSDSSSGQNGFSCLNGILGRLSSEYVHFMMAGQTVSGILLQYLSSPKGQAQTKKKYAFFYQYDSLKNRKGISQINLRHTPSLIPHYFFSGFYPAEYVKELLFETEHPYDAEQLFLFSYLKKHPTYVLITDQIANACLPSSFDLDSFPDASNKAWYTKTIRETYLPYLKKNQKQDGNVPKIIQYGVFSQILMRFMHNMNIKNKRVFQTDEELDEFYQACSEAFQLISDHVLLNFGGAPFFLMPPPLGGLLLRIKHGEGISQTYSCNLNMTNFLIGYQGNMISSVKGQPIMLDVMNYEDGVLTIDASYMMLMDQAPAKITAELDGKELPLTPVTRFGHTSFFGKEVHHNYAFRIAIEDARLQPGSHKLAFYCHFLGERILLPLFAERFPGRLNIKLVGSYWRFGRHIIYTDSHREALFIEPAKFKTVFKKELRYSYALFKTSPRTLAVRAAYWLTRPYFCRKNIWVTYDKMYKGGDNGEYFFKYVKAQKRKNITPKYIINKNYPDAGRLRKEGCRPLYFGTLKQQLYFLNSRVVATTHANIPVFSGLTPQAFNLLRDLFRADVACIQHGLSVQQMEHNLNAQHDNLRKYYFASKYEIENLSKPLYGYLNQEEAFRLTGVPRYDGLVSDDRRQILIAPTWRAYISMPASIGNVRPYSDTFKNTVYYKTFQSLITNETLIAAAKRAGYRILYLLHPTITSQIHDFTPGECVEVLSPVDISYEQLLTESSLMVTDYSGVQFDFAYMRKPIVYYHPTQLPPHYEDGGFFYDTMGFGEIEACEDTLVDTLCEYMEQNCVMKDSYRKRADDFFAYSDQESCKRIFDDLYQFSKRKK